VASGDLFEWDPERAAANRRKHGASFEEATTVFAYPLAVLNVDPDQSPSEERYLVLGTSEQGWSSSPLRSDRCGRV